jgi:DNA-binding GntR family transcriptional regulator
VLLVDLVAIDHGAAEFPYLQLARILRERIASGEYPAGRQIPALIALEEEFGLSSMTVRRAVAMLAEEGLLVRVPGRGTFVSGDPQ